MKTAILLEDLGLGALASKAIEEGLEGTTAFLETWQLKDVPPRHAEEQGQLAELLIALGQEEEVVKAVCSDLASMGEWEWRGQEAFMKSVSRFAWLADLLLRLQESPDMRQVAKWAEAASEGFGDWRASNHLDRVWGDVIVWHLRRQVEVRWELESEEDGWVMKEEWSGLSFGIGEGPLPPYAKGMAWEVERRLECKFFSDAYTETSVPEVERLYQRAMETVGEALLTEGLALVGVETFDPQGEGLYELWQQLEEVDAPPGRASLAVCEAANRVMDAWCDQAEG